MKKNNTRPSTSDRLDPQRKHLNPMNIPTSTNSPIGARKRRNLSKSDSTLRNIALALASSALTGLSGCVATPDSSSPYSPQTEAARDPLKAQALTLEAADLMSKLDLDLDIDHQARIAQAERLLREALAADLYHGPAHNNLGAVYLKQQKLYEAAGEFEWARKLMPGHPDPRMNLAFTLERAGRTDEAISTYRTALEVYPGHIPTYQALTRLQLRKNKPNEQTRPMLQAVALQGETQPWREWAQKMLAVRGHAIP